ncbi:MAG: polyprenyl synthetase family protein [Pseudomonadota bacterium]
MIDDARIEAAIVAALDRHLSASCPPRLASAVRYAVLPGGSRVRPKLCQSVALACGADDLLSVDAACVAIELLHCASLVHDDLPCFDDAPVRRGKPTVHIAFDERLALLCGDELIVMAFEVLAQGAAQRPERLQALMAVIGKAVGAPNGIIAGQAYECEPGVDLRAYQQAKTGALFAASTAAGAAAAGADVDQWVALGAHLGEAYQVADDLRDVHASAEVLGKPVGQDQRHNRPSAVAALGSDSAMGHLRGLLQQATDSIPACQGRDALTAVLQQQSDQIIAALQALRSAA